MEKSTHNRSTHNRPTQIQILATIRIFAVILPCCWAFMLNDITAIHSGHLSALGRKADAVMLQFIPLLLLVPWIVCFQVWITNCRTSLGWTIRLVGLYLVSLTIAGSIWLSAFRNTSTLRIQSLPEHSEILAIEEFTNLQLSWHGGSDGEFVTYDTRHPDNEPLLKEALRNHGVVILE